MRLSAYLRYIFKEYKVYFFSLFSIAILASIMNIALNYKVKEIIDVVGVNASADVSILLALFVTYKFGMHGVFFIQRILDMRYKPKLLNEVVTYMYKQTVGHSLHWFDSHLAGEITGKISDFQHHIISTMITCCFSAFRNVLIIVISIIYLLNISILPVVVLSVFVLVYIAVLGPLLKKQMQLQEQYISARQQALGVINDSISNAFGVKVIGSILNEFKLKLSPLISNWSNWDKKTRQFDAYWVDNADTILSTIMNAVQIYLLVYLYRTGEITAGGFAFVAMITLKMHTELDQLLENLLFNINPGIASMKASFAFINSEYDVADAVDAVKLEDVKGEIKFVNVCFRYSGGVANIFTDLNLHIKAGQRVGIVGASGAGKTTLVKCILRYFDVLDGKVTIDGYDISSVTQESLRAKISVIPQDITMFHRSILENLQIAKHDATFDEIVAACKKARIHHDIEKMQHGYQSIVGERGVKVSGGQRQRIAIARAILKNAPILILDEATSALDTPTEKLIQESLHEILQSNNFTTIVIAHRLSTLLHMDRIITFESGKIMEDGAHQDLISKNALYKKLWDAQIDGFLPECIIDNIVYYLSTVIEKNELDFIKSFFLKKLPRTTDKKIAYIIYSDLYKGPYDAQINGFLPE